jgi:ATP-binding cassette subfamily F protein uup
MPLISLLEGSLAYGELPLLDRAAFSLESGERIGLIGRNGTGKSSLLGVIAGSVALDDGELRRRDGLRVALVEQEPAFPALTGNHRLREFLHRLRLDPDLAPAAMSGGERKRRRSRRRSRSSPTCSSSTSPPTTSISRGFSDWRNCC